MNEMQITAEEAADANEVVLSMAATALRANNKYLSEKSARYMAALAVGLMWLDSDSEKAAIAVNDILLARARRGDAEAIEAAREDAQKYIPAYVTALAGGTDPVVALAMAHPMGAVIARQNVEMLELLEGLDRK